MRKLVSCLVAILLFAFMAAAQTSMGSGQKTDPTAAKSKSKSKKVSGGEKSSTVTGCISGPTDEGVYVLKNGRYRKGIEVGGSDDLKSHVGHEVKLTGTWAKSGAEIGETESAEKERNEKPEKGSAAERHFKVSNISMVSETCTATAGKTKGKKAKSSSSAPTT